MATAPTDHMPHWEQKFQAVFDTPAAIHTHINQAHGGSKRGTDPLHLHEAESQEEQAPSTAYAWGKASLQNPNMETCYQTSPTCTRPTHSGSPAPSSIKKTQSGCSE
ncbi:Hypothetical predicted protein [Pelobates cultripes]|uniref:Uncharacterized protein n=1 Tax=Pelobates cultripes TaxID=61616 RepID=A0AAD1R0Z8_PELCU|nr:Hypothetical predicted protein [Pelobates cultripes]